jgi:hypothetical protein
MTLRSKDFIPNTTVSKLFGMLAVMAVSFSQTRTPSNDAMAEFISQGKEKTSQVTIKPAKPSNYLNASSVFQSNMDATADLPAQRKVRQFNTNINFSVAKTDENSNVLTPAVAAWERNKRLQKLFIS